VLIALKMSGRDVQGQSMRSMSVCAEGPHRDAGRLASRTEQRTANALESIAGLAIAAVVIIARTSARDVTAQP
jgi:hypothetical protein